ncbi:MAG: ribosome-associated translation inhibitor RaiA [Polyangiaceae bacterium]|nr:ribosome-associated translation inhibitor RaiA [Polyangiaceae bacterium]
MNLNISFRHFESTDAIKKHTRSKLEKLQRFLRSPMTAKVTLSVDQRRHVAEAQISSGGEHLEAKEASDDMYASIDRLIEKLERQIQGAKGAVEAKRRTGSLKKVVKVSAPMPEPVAPAAKVAKKKAPAKKAPAKKAAKKV